MLDSLLLLAKETDCPFVASLRLTNMAKLIDTYITQSPWPYYPGDMPVMRGRKRALRLDPVVTSNLANKVVHNKRAKTTIAFARATHIMPATTAAHQSHHAMADYLWTGMVSSS